MSAINEVSDKHERESSEKQSAVRKGEGVETEAARRPLGSGGGFPESA